MPDTKTLHEIILPRLSETDEESLITFWHKSEGDVVKKGDVLVEVQTEKAVSEIESDVDGVIVKINKKRGDVIAVGESLASIAEDGASLVQESGMITAGGASQSVQQDKPETGFVKASPRARKLAKDLGIDLALVPATGKNGVPTPADVQNYADNQTKASGLTGENQAGSGVDTAKPVLAGNTQNATKSNENASGQSLRIIATPSVRKLAREKRVDLTQLQQRVNGKIERSDVLKFAEEREQATKITPAPIQESTPENNEEVEVVKLVGIRKAIAKAMTHSKQTTPHVTHFAEVDVTALVEHRSKFKEAAKAKNIKLTFLPYVVKALIGALKEYKELNASIDEAEENILYKKFYNIGIAVNTDNGLVVPVVRHADQKSIARLAREIDEFTTSARENKLSMADMTGGTCTISNIGSAGGDWFTPVINHPETAILGIGQITEKPIVKNGEVAIGKMLPLSLSYDHRVIDGVIAQNALNHIKKLLQDPELLLLELD